ncbi:transporter [Muricomes sp. OA1]|uniref:Transporter n=1 Tax=Hungatella hathewayi TaxID=154046 RepID=A0A3E2WVJ2_9FIRM|nr:MULTISPECIES: hypothetical protein [Clostridia]MCH1973352.1 transporter [Muricomes sp. OA1]MSC85577.1 transporter [Eubacterium sp. BIOML-A1]MSD08032.1 transporter [Eubacterium sp. BIOML-A2]RGC31616.1 transporter [Hungatella hathewayi]RYT13363.1 transporter [Eubacterium sp. am_0171]
MSTFYKICIALSAGLLIGMIGGGIKAAFLRKTYSDEKVRSTRRLINKTAAILKYITILLLLLGLIWCSYFLVMAILSPAKADYANNMAELIVSVLTVISILFAFVEFLRKKGD